MNNCVKINDTNHFYKELIRKHREHKFFKNVYRSDIVIFPVIEEKIDQLASVDILNQKFYKNLFSIYTFYLVAQQYYSDSIINESVHRATVSIQEYQEELNTIKIESKYYNTPGDVAFAEHRIKMINCNMKEAQQLKDFCSKESNIFCGKTLAMLRWFIATNCINKDYGIFGDEINTSLEK